MANDNPKDLTETHYPSDIFEDGSLELEIWWQRYREWEQDQCGEFPTVADIYYLVNLNEFVRDANGNIRRLDQPRLPLKPSDLEDDQAGPAD